MKTNKPQVMVEPEVAELADLYIALVTKLHAINEEFNKNSDQLAACESAVVAVKRFLDANEMVFASGITRPLGTLAAAVRDVQSGAKPKLFQVDPLAAGGRPSSPVGDAIKATAAACLEFLHKSGKEELETASLFVAKELHKIGIKTLGPSRPVTNKTVKGWRNEMNGRNSSLANNIFMDIKKGLADKLGGDVSSEAARQVVRSSLAGLAAEGVTPAAPSP